MSDAIITAALTGPIATRADHPALPTTPEEIAAAAQGASEAGAAVVHVHLRDADGKPTADVDTARRVLALIEERCPAIIQLSTGVGLEVPYPERARLVEARPQMATLNVCSMSFGAGEFSNPPDGVRRLAARMSELEIRPELEIYDSGHIAMALALVEEGLLSEPLQFSIVLGVRGGAPATADSLVQMVGRLPPGAVWAGHRHRSREPGHDRDGPGDGRQRPHRPGGHADAAPRSFGSLERRIGGAAGRDRSGART